jgi:endonuclease/exonuclease/phosphatase family metal-dependent hydrolase
MKILSFNIHKGFSLGRRFSLPAVRTALHSTEADIVFLQEVIGEHRKHAQRISSWPEVQHCEYLADSVYPHRVYGLNATYLESNHGNAVLSKFPLLYWANVNLSTNKLEQRGCLHVVLSLPEFPRGLHCLCVHLNLLHRSRLSQVMLLCSRINGIIGRDEPFILAGDFNDWSEKLSAIVESETGARDIFHTLTGEHAVSYPSVFPFLKLDRIYIRGIEPISANVLTEKSWRRLSDHLPITAQIRLPHA